MEGMARGLLAARTNFGGLTEKLSAADEPRSVAADACRCPRRTGSKLPGTRRNGVTQVSRYGYPAGSGPLVRRAFGASGMEERRRRNDADVSRHRRGSSIRCAATLSLDPFSRKALPQTWLAGPRTTQLLRQGSGGDADRSQRAIAAFDSGPRAELLSRRDASARRGG